MPEPLVAPRGCCRWMLSADHALLTKSLRRRDMVTCCRCKSKINYERSYVTVPFALSGKPLPLPVFLHCHKCMLTTDSTLAYMEAYRNDHAASLPDPEKVKREEELNQRYGIRIGESVTEREGTKL